MAAPTSAKTFTDDELRKLAGHLTPDDIAALTDDEVVRLDALSQAAPTDTATERRTTEALPVSQPSPVSQDANPSVGPFPPDEVQRLISAASMDPLAGKPTLAAFEAQKAQEAQASNAPVAMSPSLGAHVPGPPLPEDPVTFGNLGRRINETVSAAASTAGPPEFLRGLLGSAADQLAPEFAGAPEPRQIQPMPPDVGPQQEALNDPAIAEARLRNEQAARIQGGQPMEAFRGAGPSLSRSASGALDEMLPHVIPQIIQGEAESLSEFLFNPARQLAQHPIEFGSNVLFAAQGLTVIRKTGSALSLLASDAKFAEKSAKAGGAEVSALEAVIKGAKSEEVAGAYNALETKLDQVSILKDLNRVFADDPVMLRRLREMEARLQAMQNKITAARVGVAETGQLKFAAGDRVTPVSSSHAGGKTFTVQSIESGPGGRTWVNVADEQGATSRFHPDFLEHVEKPPVTPGPWAPTADAVNAKIHLTDALAASPAGVILLKGALKDDQEDPTPRNSSPLSIKSALWSGVGVGILGFGLYRYFTAPAFREALRGFTRLDKTKPADLERLFETYIFPMIPDTPANGKLVNLWPDRPAGELQRLVPGAVLGSSAAFGAYVGSGSGQREISGPGTVLGLLAGVAVGGAAMTAFSKMFATEATYRQLYQRVFTEAAGLSAGAHAAKVETRIALDGRIAEIRDVSLNLSKHGPKTGALIQDWMAGNINLDMVPEAARWDAAYGRFLLDDLALDLLSSGLLKEGVLTDKITSQLGTYTPRLLLQYELEARPMEKVAAYLHSQGEGWGYISNKTYTKRKKPLPPEVLEALGEITDNPGYLLAKRGPMLAADIEQARYHRFLLASEESSIPDGVVKAALKDKNAYGRLLKEDRLANQADLSNRQENIGVFDTWETSYRDAAMRDAAEERNIGQPMSPKDIKLWDKGRNWEEYSKKAGYTEAEIEGHRRLLALEQRGLSLGLSKDEIHAIRNEARSGVDKLPDLLPGVNRSLQQKAEKAIGEKTIAGSYAYLDPERTLPRFFGGGQGVKAAAWEGRTYWKMPDDERYGLIAGKYVEQSVAHDIRSVHETVSGLQRVFNVPLSLFKYFKAVMNPASQFRNMVTNAIFADIEAGVGPWHAESWYNGLTDINRQTQRMREARRAGLFGGNFTAAEIQDLVHPGLDKISQKSTGIMDTISQHVTGIATDPSATAKGFTRWHQGSEAWARMVVYNKAVDAMGMSVEQAVAFARRTIPDYQDVSRWLKVVRTSPFGAPFISFSYKAIPRTVEAAFAFGDPAKMMRFWKYPMAMAALNEYSAQAHGLLGKGEKRDIFGTLRRLTIRTLSAGMAQPDSYDTFRKYLPGHVGQMQIGIPWRDQYDRQQYLDGTFFLPWGDAGEMGKGDFAKHLGPSLFPRQLEPSNPWFQVGVAAVTGKDSFTGRDIIRSGAVGNEMYSDMAVFLARAWLPSLQPGAGYSEQALERSFSGDFQSDPYVKDRKTAVASEILGARTRPVDPMSAWSYKRWEFQKELDRNRSELRGLLKLPDAINLTNADIDKLRVEHPNDAISRAIARQDALIKKFDEEFPHDELQPSPKKFVDAMDARFKRKKKPQ